MITKRVDADGKTIFTEESNEQQSSAEISMNAKGDMTYKVKVYTDDSQMLEAKLKEYHIIAKKEISR